MKPRQKTTDSVTIYRSLPTRLSQEQIDDRARELARQIRQSLAAEQSAKQSAAEHKEVMKAIGKEVTRLTDAVNNGVEYRDVECRAVTMGNETTIFRQDTGEVVETRAATKEEMERLQTSILDMPGVASEEAPVR